MDIPSMDSLKGKIPSGGSKSIPQTPSIVDFKDFGTGVKCMEAFEKHTMLTLNLRGAQYAAEVNAEVIEGLLYPLIMTSDPIPKNQKGHPNVSQKVSKMDNPKNVPHPEDCLSDAWNDKLDKAVDAAYQTGKNAAKSVGDSLGNAKGPEMPDLGLSMPDLGLSMPSFGGDDDGPGFGDKVKEYKDDTEKVVGDAGKVLDETMTSLVASDQLALFKAMDAMNEYIMDTSYIENFFRWLDIDKCIKKSCTPIKGIIMDNDFMYKNPTDSKKEFSLPLDMSGGQVQLIKVFDNLPSEAKKRCNELQTEYTKYKDNKNEIIDDETSKNSTGAFSKLKEKQAKYKKPSFNIMDKLGD